MSWYHKWWEGYLAGKHKALVDRSEALIRRLEVKLAGLENEHRYLDSLGRGRMGLGEEIGETRCRLKHCRETLEKSK